MPGLSTGYTQFDTLTGGLQHIDVLMVATSPSSDGVSLALSIALHVATTSQRGVGLLCLTMNKVRITQCLLAMHAGIDKHRLRAGQLKDDEWQRVMVAAQELSRIKLWMDDPSDLCLTELRRRSRRLVDAHRISLIVIDDLSRIRSSTIGAPLEQQLQGAGEVNHGLRSLAHESGIPVIACAPLAYPVKLPRRGTSQRHNLHGRSRTMGARHFLFLSREEPPETRHTSTFPISLTQERSGLITKLSLSS
ncbi:MAG TPA: DnaB-like helicase C-terminal domain-containing protein [Ktedonobacteraceae bacterium]